MFNEKRYPNPLINIRFIDSKQALCVFWFLGSTLSAPGEDTARDFVEHVLRIPNTEELLNSVLGRLEQNRQGLMARERVTEDEDCDEPSEVILRLQLNCADLWSKFLINKN